jgi:polysaccharide pyruvyl transferase WcaK-like protein
LVGVNLRHWFSRGRFVEEPEVVDRLLGELAAALDNLIDAARIRIVFLPFRESPADNDAAVCADVRQRMRRGAETHLIDGLDTPHAAADLLASCDFAIGTRLHVLILAAASATPFLGLAYMPKVRHFAEDAGGVACDLHQGATAGYLTRTIYELFRDRDLLRDRLQQTVPALQELARLNGALPAALLGRADLDALKSEIAATRRRLEQATADEPVRRVG